MKDFIIRLVLSMVLYFLPIIPVWFIEPIKKGDENVYTTWGEIYMYSFVILLFISWYQVASRLVDKFLGKDKIV